MSEISALPANLVAWLSEREALQGIRFLTEFPATKKAIPLKHTTVAVGVGSMEISDAFTENENGVLERQEYCRSVLLQIKLSIHAPFSAGGSACHDAFTDIIDCLTFDSDLEILASGCNGITADRDTDAFVLDAYMRVQASLCPAETSALVLPSFFSKTLLCASHINDTALHLSPAQHTFLAQPFKTGSYFGTGDASRTIQLDFRPGAVLVAARGMPLLAMDGTQPKGYAAFAFQSGGTLGLSLTDSGFRLTHSANSATRGVLPQLNELGTTYYFIAFRA